MAPPDSKHRRFEKDDENSDIEYECIEQSEYYIKDEDTNNSSRHRGSTLASSSMKRETKGGRPLGGDQLKNQPLRSCMDAIKLIPDDLLYDSDNEEKKSRRLLDLLKDSSNSTTTEIPNQPPCLTVYRRTPERILVDLHTFGEIARQRLEILQGLFRMNWVNLSREDQDKMCQDVEGLLNDAGLHTWSPYVDERATVVMQDRISHFTLRLAFAQDPTAQEWFIQQESRLLQVKFWCAQRQFESEGDLELAEGLVPVLKACGVKHTIVKRNPNSIDSDEKRLWENIQKSLMAAALLSTKKNRSPPNVVLKIPFYPSAAPVVRQRKCFIKDGYGYVALPEVELVLTFHFRDILINSFKRLKDKTSLLQGEIFSNPEVASILHDLARRYSGVPSRKRGTQVNEAITLANIEKMAARSFPPCMKLLFLKLKEHKHLRHWGRLQLWLYLKKCGMSMDDQLHWWRSVWNEPDKFDKEIRYNIRHAYGQEGKRANYGAFNCSKIISGNPAPGHGEYHGCPFRHFDADPLKRFLQSYYRMPLGSMESVITLKESHQYQLACQQLFKVTHPGSDGEGVGNHPNAYFAESCRCHAPKDETKPQQQLTAEGSVPAATLQESQQLMIDA